MTNILLLTQFGPASAFSIVNNSDWLDSIFFGSLGSPTNPINLVCSITNGQNTISVLSAVGTAGLVPGMPIASSPGIPTGAFIGAITSSSQFTMVNGSGSALNATQTNAEAELTVNPIPLDLTGISFQAQLRPSATSTNVNLTLSTAAGTLLSGGTGGSLGFNVPYTMIQNIAPGTYVLDIIAMGDGHTINLFPEGPASVTVLPGVTTP